jgi:hypothetical protein
MLTRSEGSAAPGTLLGWAVVRDHGEVLMKIAAIGAVGLLTVAGGLFAQKASSFSVRNGDIFSSEFTGEILDSFCAEGGSHIGVIKSSRNTSQAGCTLACVKLAGAEFVLYDPENKGTYKLDDQQQPEAFAGQRVTVTGTYDRETNTVRVTKIRPVILAAF